MPSHKLIIISPHIENTKGGVATFVKNLTEHLECKLYITQSEEGPLSYKSIQFLKIIFFFFKLLISPSVKIVYAQGSEINSIYRKLAYLIISKLLFRKCIMHIHAATLNNTFKDKFATYLIKLFNIQLIVLSDYWKIRFSELGYNSSIVVPNPVLDSSLYEIKIEKIYDPKIKILFLGRVGKRKGIDVLINALKILNKNCTQDIEVIVAGDGEVNKYNSICKKSNIKNIEFVGWANDSKRRELLTWANVICLPSRNEGMPLSIIEGMAAAKIIIASDIPPIRYGFKRAPRGLLLFKNENFNDLSDRINSLLGMNSDETNELMKSNRIYAKDILSYEKFIKKITPLISK